MSAARVLRAGVVGVGSLGQHHARIYTQMKGVELVGVVDTDADRAAEIAERHGVSVYPDTESLARMVNLATVATPTLFHEEAATPLLEAGVATLVEKPIAAEMAVGERMIALARRRGAMLMVGHTERFHPVVSALIEASAHPRFLEMHRLAPFVPRGLDVDVILDLMIHDLDLARLLVGRSRLRSLDASGAAVLTDKIDIASVRLRFENGAAANITASRVSRERMRRIRAFGPGVCVGCDALAGEARVTRVIREAGKTPALQRESLEIPSGEPLGRELAAFSEALRGGKEAPVSGEDALAALELALAIRDAVQEDLTQQGAGK